MLVLIDVLPEVESLNEPDVLSLSDVLVLNDVDVESLSDSLSLFEALIEVLVLSGVT